MWLELIIHPTALLVFQDLPETTAAGAPPRGGAGALLRGGRVALDAAVAGSLTLLVGAFWRRGLGPDGAEVEHARALALATLTLASGAITAVLGRLRSRAAWIVPGVATALSVALLEVPALSALVHVRPLDPDDWAAVIAGVLVAVALPLELRVRLAGRRHARRPAT